MEPNAFVVTEQFGVFDWATIIFYFLFLLSIGIVTRYFIKGTSDYFRGGGKMLWWMAGASAFMQQFSAWSFTGAASEAFTNGGIILVIFFANAVGYFGNFAYFAPKLRQLRVITPIQAVRQRFGKVGEQFFTWASFPTGVLYAGIWLCALGIFVSSVFGLNLRMSIIIVGAIVVFNSTISGSWAVVSSDFMQTLILMVIAVVTAVFSLVRVGGIGNIIENFPVSPYIGGGYNYFGLLMVWVTLMFFNQFFKLNHMIDASRYLNAKTSQHAKKAALLAAVLMTVGPILWFIPPMVSRIMDPNIAEIFPQLNKPAEASYILAALRVLPNGMLGLLLAGIFAATISSMDSGLNKNAGIFVKNFYTIVINKKASEARQMLISRVTTVILGVCVVVAALYYSEMKNLGLFDLMIQFGAYVGVPIAVPLFWGLLVKKTPDWSGWSTVVVGAICGILLKNVFTPDWFADTFGLDFTPRDGRYYKQYMGVLFNITFPSIWFFLTKLWYKEPKTPERKDEIATYWKNLATPVTGVEDGTGDEDKRQGKTLGILASVYGGFIFLLMFIPNSWSGRLAFMGGGLALLLVAYSIYRSTHPKAKA